MNLCSKGCKCQTKTECNMLNTKQEEEFIEFNYDPSYGSVSESLIQIGSLHKLCSHWGAEIGSREYIGLCWSNVNVRFEYYSDPPDLLKKKHLVNEDHRNFRKNIWKYITLMAHRMPCNIHCCLWMGSVDII